MEAIVYLGGLKSTEFLAMKKLHRWMRKTQDIHRMRKTNPGKSEAGYPISGYPLLGISFPPLFTVSEWLEL